MHETCIVTQKCKTKKWAKVEEFDPIGLPTNFYCHWVLAGGFIAKELQKKGLRINCSGALFRWTVKGQYKL